MTIDLKMNKEAKELETLLKKDLLKRDVWRLMLARGIKKSNMPPDERGCNDPYNDEVTNQYLADAMMYAVDEVSARIESCLKDKTITVDRFISIGKALVNVSDMIDL